MNIGEHIAGAGLKNASYIGDGVYVAHDGFQVWLLTDRDEGIHEIALEPRVFAELVAYVDDLGARQAEKELEES